MGHLRGTIDSAVKTNYCTLHITTALSSFLGGKTQQALSQRGNGSFTEVLWQHKCHQKFSHLELYCLFQQQWGPQTVTNIVTFSSHVWCSFNESAVSCTCYFEFRVLFSFKRSHCACGFSHCQDLLCYNNSCFTNMQQPTLMTSQTTKLHAGKPVCKHFALYLGETTTILNQLRIWN